MSNKRLALRVTRNSVVMIIAVYLVMQVFTYFRDGLILGVSDLSDLLAMTAAYMFSVVIPPALVLGLILYLLALRIQRVACALERGETIPDDELERTRKRLIGFSKVVLAENIVGFASGYVIFVVSQGFLHEILRFDRLVVLVSNLAGGVIYASAQNALNEIVFADVRDRLGIREIGERRRERSTTGKQIGLSAALVVYAVTFIQFNVKDTVAFNKVGDDILAGVVSGSILPEDAGTAYRSLLAERLPELGTRSSVGADDVPLPWERADSAVRRQQTMFIMYAAFTLCICCAVQTIVSSSLRRQLQAIANRVKDVLDGGGDLRIRLSIRAMDDLGELTELLNRLLDRFHSIARDIGHTARRTRESSEAIDRELIRSESLARGTRETVRELETTLQSQAAATRTFVDALRSFRDGVAAADAATEDQKRFVAETSAAMEEMAASIRSISSMTERAGSLSGRLSESGDAGSAAVRDTRAAIDEINAAAREVLGVLTTLNKISADINLLAMNAAIEAAHAGEHGQGFAVVADEVRTLAGNAAQRTRAIKELIQAMGARVDNGVRQAEASGAALAGLTAGLGESASISREIAAAAKEQAAGTDAVIGSITQAVRSADTVSAMMGDQARRSDEIAMALEGVLRRLEGLAADASRQTREVTALEESFAAVRKEVDGNLESVGALGSEMARFSV